MKTTILGLSAIFLFTATSFADKSGNWSGYAIDASHSGYAFTSIYATWVMPALTPIPDTDSSFWIGFDGYGNSTVEQCGIQALVDHLGQVKYQPWYEFYPQYQQNIYSFDVNAGDVISALITYSVSDTTYNIVMQNLTASNNSLPYSYSNSFVTNVGTRTSVEWIAEAPNGGTGVQPLADYGTMSFSNCMANLTGVDQPLNQFSYVSLTMTNPDGSDVSVPTSIIGSNAFTVNFVPEPSTYALFGLGVIGMVIAFRRKKTA